MCPPLTALTEGERITIITIRPAQERGCQQAGQGTVQLRDKDINITIKRGIISPARRRKVCWISPPRHIYVPACVEGERVTIVTNRPVQKRGCQQGVDDEVFGFVVGGYGEGVCTWSVSVGRCAFSWPLSVSCLIYPPLNPLPRGDFYIPLSRGVRGVLFLVLHFAFCSFQFDRGTRGVKPSQFNWKIIRKR